MLLTWLRKSQELELGSGKELGDSRQSWNWVQNPESRFGNSLGVQASVFPHSVPGIGFLSPPPSVQGVPGVTPFVL